MTRLGAPSAGRILAALLVAVISGCGRETPPRDRPPIVGVTTSPVERVDLPERIEAGGVVRARASALLVSRILAPVVEVRVAPGDRVRRGQVLVVLDDRDLTAQARRATAETSVVEQVLLSVHSDRAAADAASILAQASHARIVGLQERGSATAQELDEAVAALRAAEARAQGAEARVEAAIAAVASARAAGEAANVLATFSRITAPFDGVVTEKLVEAGNMAGPGSALVRVEDTSGLQVEALLDESRVASIQSGTIVQAVLAGADGREDPVEARVVEIGRFVEADRRAFRVKVELPAESSARPGSFARLRFDGPPRSTFLIPLAAVMRHGQVTSVFVVEQGAVRLRLVGLGPAVGARVEVLAGLDVADEVVTSPPPGLSDGQPVVVGPSAEGGR